MSSETISPILVKCLDDNGDECDCFEITCPSCGETPILVPVSRFLDENTQECPRCDMIFRHSFRYEMA